MDPRIIYMELLQVCLDRGWKQVESPMFTHTKGTTFIALSYSAQWCYFGPDHLVHTYMTNGLNFYHKGREISHDTWMQNVKEHL